MVVRATSAQAHAENLARDAYSNIAEEIYSIIVELSDRMKTPPTACEVAKLYLERNPESNFVRNDVSKRISELVSELRVVPWTERRSPATNRMVHTWRAVTGATAQELFDNEKHRLEKMMECQKKTLAETEDKYLRLLMNQPAKEKA